MISPTETEVEPLTEHRLLALGWRDPVELDRVCDALNLRETDFADRLCGVAVGYLRSCASRGAEPSLTEAVDALANRAIPDASDELYFVLQDTPRSHGAIIDLAQSVQQSADARTNELCRMLARDAFRAWSHAFECPRCIGCSQAKPSQARQRTVAPNRRKVWRMSV